MIKFEENRIDVKEYNYLINANLKFDKIKKVSIIGGSGSGKSTLSKNLAIKLELPVIHIDGLNYDPDWVQKDKNKRDEILLEKIQESKWVMDGTYKSTLSKRLQASDLIIFLDYSTISLLYGVISRRIKLIGKEREEISGCKDILTLKFLKFVITWRKKSRKVVLDKLKKYEDKVLIFKSRRMLNDWFKANFNEEITL